MPIDRMRPASSNRPVTPTTALSLSKARVVAGSFRSTLPALSCAFSSSGKASASTLRPTAKAVFGLTPAPTPPFFAPAIAWCSCKASPKNASEPKRSKRKIRRPSSSMRWACRAIWRSFSECGFRDASRSSPPHPSPTTRASPISTETADGRIALCLMGILSANEHGAGRILGDAARPGI